MYSVVFDVLSKILKGLTAEPNKIWVYSIIFLVLQFTKVIMTFLFLKKIYVEYAQEVQHVKL